MMPSAVATLLSPPSATKSRVSIGYQADFPPFMQEGDPPAGLVIDALDSGVDALRRAGVDVGWVPLTLAGQMPALADGRVDMLAGLAVTAERRHSLVFGKPLVRTGGALFVARGTSASLVRRIVTPASGPLRAPVSTRFPDCELVDAEDYPDALSRVVEGRAAAAALNLHVGSALAEREFAGLFELPRELFAALDLAPAYPPNHDVDLRRLLDEHSAGGDG